MDDAEEADFLLLRLWRMQTTRSMTAIMRRTPATAMPAANFRVDTQKSSSDNEVGLDSRGNSAVKI